MSFFSLSSQGSKVVPLHRARAEKIEERKLYQYKESEEKKKTRVTKPSILFVSSWPQSRVIERFMRTLRRGSFFIFVVGWWVFEKRGS